MEQGSSVKRSPSQEEGVAETVRDGLTAVPCAPVPLTGRRDRTQEKS